MLPQGYEFRPLTVDDAAALAAAYVLNWPHLAAWEPPRDEAFFTEAGQRATIEAKLEQVRSGQLETWLVVHGEEVVGRISLDNIVRGPLQSASVGYWIAAAHTRRGLATAAVELAVQRAREIGLHRVEAGTRLDNEPSQAVLKRSGFEQYGLAEKFLFIDGEWRDHILFQRILHDDPLGTPTPAPTTREEPVELDLQAPPLVFPGRGPETAYRTAHDLLSRRAPREALEVIEPALEQEPGNTGLRSLRAWAYLLRAQLQRAEQELAALVEERPDDDWARHALGRSLERQARLAEALPHLRLAAAMSGDPEHELAVLRVERRLAETGQTSYDDLT